MSSVSALRPFLVIRTAAVSGFGRDTSICHGGGKITSPRATFKIAESHFGASLVAPLAEFVKVNEASGS